MSTAPKTCHFCRSEMIVFEGQATCPKCGNFVQVDNPVATDETISVQKLWPGLFKKVEAAQ